MPDPIQPLPHAPIERVLGLLQYLREAPGGREDLYKLGGPLGYELDDLLPVVEAAKRLGLVRVVAGDIELTPSGQALAGAEEPERKKRLARDLKKLSIIADIRRALARARSGRVARARFRQKLREHFSEAEAERQLATALDWARYGELFDFDPDADEFVLQAS
jgi:NitT/TauT family transport system ATP-binding protein